MAMSTQKDSSRALAGSTGSVSWAAFAALLSLIGEARNHSRTSPDRDGRAADAACEMWVGADGSLLGRRGLAPAYFGVARSLIVLDGLTLQWQVFRLLMTKPSENMRYSLQIRIRTVIQILFLLFLNASIVLLSVFCIFIYTDTY